MILILACESSEEKEQRLQRAEQIRIEKEAEQKRKEEENSRREEAERIEREIFNRFINNSLANGSTPYSGCYGGNRSCKEWGCSEIKVVTPRDSDVVVIIKSNDRVVRHAFIKASSSYTFQLPNGTYQPFFYYGKGWNPEKAMKSNSCQNFKGGFVSDEVFGKDIPQQLDNDILTYELILQRSGNFSTKPSSPLEAF